MSFSLLPHQVDAIGKLKRGSILVGGVGSGKSITSLCHFNNKWPCKDIYVITTAKKRNTGEWFGDAMKMSLRANLVVDSWNNIKKYVGVKNACFIFDEQKLVGKGAWVDAFLEIADNNDWILLSATPADTWMDLIPVFLAHGFFESRTEFHNAHVQFNRFVKYPKVDRFVDEKPLYYYRDQVYVEMPFETPGERVETMISVDFNLKNEHTLLAARWNYEEDRPLQNAGELMALMRRNTNTDPSRLVKLKELIEKHRRVIVFYNHNPELEILRTLHTDLDIPIAEYNGQNHEPVPEGDDWVYLVQYQAGSEAWNCITTNTIVFYSLPYSYKQYEQSKGRIDRMNTKYTHLYYYIFKSGSTMDRMIWRALHRKKDFQPSRFAKQVWPDDIAA